MMNETSNRMEQCVTHSKLLPINWNLEQPKAIILNLEVYQWQIFFAEFSDLDSDFNKNLIDYKTGNILFKYRYIVLERFFNQEFDNRLPLTRMPYLFGDLVNKEVELWVNLLKMLERVNTLGHLSEYGSVPEILSALIHEREIVLFIALHKGENPYTAKECHSQLQHQNGKLRFLENPFNELTAPTTYKIFNLAIRLSKKKQ
jgi:hypothetical protein